MAGIECGSQVVLCDTPIRIDTYKGCSHACKYCFVKRKSDITNIEPVNCVKSLRGFIEGKRTITTSWCDWNIPLHWGGLSDPFQPCEKQYRISYECLKIFAETKYPFIVSTKGSLIAGDEYLDLLKQCNAVVQISMICNKYDVIEQGCPTYEERLKVVEKVSKAAKRVNIRVQPYMPEVFNDLMDNIPRLKKAGAYGLQIEGMKFIKKMPGMEKVGGDWCYPLKTLERDFTKIKRQCHKYGLKFYCAENRLRYLGDDMCCCGIDGLEEFKGNSFNLCHFYNDDVVKPTEQMNKIGTAKCFNSLCQTGSNFKEIKQMSFTQKMIDEFTNKSDNYKSIFGKK